METTMQTPMFWLAATLLLTGLLWMPYILNQMAVRGVIGALGYDETPLAPWAQRAKRAHYNAIENIAVYAPIVLSHIVLGTDPAKLLVPTMVYFFVRLAHYIVYTAKVPVVRTIAFLSGWAITLYLAVILLGAA